jgi:hypothetical protein
MAHIGRQVSLTTAITIEASKQATKIAIESLQLMGTPRS